MNFTKHSHTHLPSQSYIILPKIDSNPESATRLPYDKRFLIQLAQSIHSSKNKKPKNNNQPITIIIKKQINQNPVHNNRSNSSLIASPIEIQRQRSIINLKRIKQQRNFLLSFYAKENIITRAINSTYLKIQRASEQQIRQQRYQLIKSQQHSRSGSYSPLHSLLNPKPHRKLKLILDPLKEVNKHTKPFIMKNLFQLFPVGKMVSHSLNYSISSIQMQKMPIY